MFRFIEAVKQNYVDEVKKYIEIFDPSYNSNWAIRYASENGYTKIVRLLLSDPRVDPSVFNNFAIYEASQNGHIEVIRLLLSDSRVDPSAFNNQAIRSASFFGHTEVVRLLLSDPRVDPSAFDNYAIRVASINGRIEVVCLLLSDPRVDFKAIENKEMKRQLLKEERNKLRREFTFRYQVIQRASPQILIEGKQKSKIPSVLIIKIVDEASYQERSTSIRLLALASLLKN